VSLSPENFDGFGVTEQNIHHPSPFTTTQRSVPFQIIRVSGQKLFTDESCAQTSALSAES
jgi:hypothetical protein